MDSNKEKWEHLGGFGPEELWVLTTRSTPPWISVNDELPPEGKYVIAKHNKTTWLSDDPNVNTVVVKLRRGITMEERDAFDIADYKQRKRALTIYPEDQHGNNALPYRWFTFGPQDFFGQEITHWMHIPNL